MSIVFIVVIPTKHSIVLCLCHCFVQIHMLKTLILKPSDMPLDPPKQVFRIWGSCEEVRISLDGFL